ncbi:MAG: JAB domain-containing protein [Bacteroidales bacterium]|nr:JAB domain-containing protein [Bacteroidales bacterium]
MNQNLFLNNIAEVKISYSTNVRPSDRAKITSSKDAADIFRQVFPGFEHREYFYAMLLNRGNHVLGYYEVSKGGIAGTAVDVRLILQAALKANASSIILAHNHPSGTLEVSDSDLSITRKIKQACLILDISMLDHIILTNYSFTSMADEGLI